ncbi:aldo/keto reductase [Burkholderia sp. Ac-20365]|uniref:aldo/keto reductase n=1 Tax=Burkholderia sp. Ac-20365 TaxID=2703897 RepID=UPI00197B9570|nr:aldo/keto reductase [Burkholderia sp. Ac-20365]
MQTHPSTRRDFLQRTLALPLAMAIPRLASAQDSSKPLPQMERRKIPSTGEPLPIVGCGTWRTFDVDNDPNGLARLADVLKTLFAAGGSVIDSSPMYGSSEAVAGTLLTRLDAHSKAFVATKVWTQGKAAGIAQMEESMRRFQQPRIDLMQVHNLVDWRTQIATLRDWKAQGRVRYIGITHYTSSAFDEVASVMRSENPDFVQINYAADDRDAEQRILPLARDLGIGVVVNQPFGGGGLLSRVSKTPLPAFAADIGCMTWAQLLLKFVLAQPAVTVVIPGTGRPEYMADNVRAGIGPYPDKALCKRIVEAVGG